MSFGIWCDLFDHWKSYHNMKIQRILFEEPRKETSILDL